jgi:hypothetical protein
VEPRASEKASVRTRTTCTRGIASRYLRGAIGARLNQTVLARRERPFLGRGNRPVLGLVTRGFLARRSVGREPLLRRHRGSSVFKGILTAYREQAAASST